MIEKIFSIKRLFLFSFITDETSIKFTASEHKDLKSFQESRNKRFSFGANFEIKYDSIKAVTKQEDREEIRIKYKQKFEIPLTYTFSFNKDGDSELFFNFLEKEKHFTRIDQNLTPLRAIKKEVMELILTIMGTIFLYYQAIESEANPSSSSSGLFKVFLDIFGTKGVIAVGTLIGCSYIYEIFRRFRNPPKEVNLFPSDLSSVEK